MGSYSLSLTIYLQFLQIALMEEEAIFANISDKTLSKISFKIEKSSMFVPCILMA